MAIKIISHRQRIEEVEYFIFYEYVEQPGAGFMFPANQHGDLLVDEMSEEGMENYEKCDSEEYPVVYHGLQRSVNRYWEPAVGECSCGREVVLEGNTNQCGCGSYYNQIGQQLSHPSNWGEETGEHPSDILREM
jgi:hypothetical protein